MVGEIWYNLEKGSRTWLTIEDCIVETVDGSEMSSVVSGYLRVSGKLLLCEIEYEGYVPKLRGFDYETIEYFYPDTSTTLNKGAYFLLPVLGHR